MIIPLGNGIEAEVTEPERGMFPATLGGAVEFTIAHFVFAVLGFMGQGIGTLLGSSAVWFLHTVEPDLVEYARPLIDELLRNPETPAWLSGILGKMASGEREIDGMFAGGMVSGAVTGTIGSFLEPALTMLGYAAWSLNPIREPDIDSLIRMGWRKAYGPEAVAFSARSLGFREEIVEGFEDVARPRIGSYDLIRWMFRQLLEDGGVAEELGKRGYTAEDIAKMQEFARPLTSPDDLQDMMFRRIIGEGALPDRLRQHGYSNAQVGEFADYMWHLLPINDIIELWKREGWDDGTAIERLRHHGFNAEEAQEILKIARPLTGPGDLTQLWWRSQPNGFPYGDRLKEHGYTDEQVAEFEELAQRIPPPPDLISMAVREAWDEEMIAEYSYMDRFPEPFKEWMLKQGYSQEWAERYWVAHWRLPSIQQAFEMLHRGEIEETDIKRLLSAADIAPHWHTPIINTAYRPLTRVDVRRMYGLGVLDETEVKEAYEHLGYNDLNAERMKEFTIRYASSGERDLTKTDVLQAFRSGVIGQDEARSALEAIGYAPIAVAWMLSYEEWKQEQEILDDEVALLKDQYIEGQIDRAAVFAALGKWNLPARQVQLYLQRWDVTKERKITLPTVSQLEKFLLADIIDRSSYLELMQKRHYSLETAGSFLAEINYQIAENAKKEEERAQKEKERVEIAIEKTDYAVERADLDLQIAELKTAVAESYVLLTTLTDREQIDAILDQIDKLRMSVIYLNQRKAEAKLEYTRTLRGFIQ